MEWERTGGGQHGVDARVGLGLGSVWLPCAQGVS